jgi:hypothetical protein
MNRHILTTFRILRAAVFLTLAVWGCVDSRLLAQTVSSPDGPLGAVLLKNNRVLLGTVTRQGDVFVVEVANQSAVSLPKDQVDFVAETIREIYAYKIHCVTRWNVGEHFQLTRWCMVNQLLDEAVLHYREVAKQAGDHPRVKQLAVELKSQMLEVPEFRSYLGLAPISELVSRPTPAVNSAAAASPVVSASSTLRVVQHPQVVQNFSERIQPILMNRCSQAACHGIQSQQRFQITEPYAKSSAETSSANLSSTLEQVAESSNSISPLMIYATKAHGLQRKPGIAVTESGLIAELSNWIQFVQNPVVSAEGSSAPAAQNQFGSGQYENWKNEMRPLPLPASDPANALNPVPFGSNQLKQVPQASPASAPAPSNPKPAVTGFPIGEAAPTDSELDALEKEINQLLGPANPKDPFDPAEFNRQMGNLRP